MTILKFIYDFYIDCSQIRLNHNIKAENIFNQNYKNKNPRNLEWSGHQYKRFGWNLQYPPKDFYHQ